ncbi:MAG: hypothetical protein Q9214_005876, partial [Letrouitia sp. 1 TL-2023]
LQLSKTPTCQGNAIMATPEINLPVDPAELYTTGPEIAAEHVNKNGPASEKTAGQPSSETPCQAKKTVPEDIPIAYHYLTFETELPQPSIQSALIRKSSGVAVPRPPDLRNYTSPFDWPDARKRYTIWLSCAVTAATAYTAGSYSPATEQMMRKWGVSQVAAYLGVTMFTTGFAIAPMVLAPFSELNGRKPVFIATGILFVVCQLCCALTQSYGGMLAARFFTGVGGSTFSTMVGGVVSDIYRTRDRNQPMALFAGAAFFGTGLGPLCSGFIAQRLLWRWVFYVQVMADGLLILLVICFFKETRGSVLLSRKARLLNEWYAAREALGLVGFEISTDNDLKVSQRIRWKVKADEERETLAKMIATEPVVFFFSLWVAFSWAVLYLTFLSIPLVFGTNHHFNIEQSGAVFAAMCVGALLSTALSIYQEKIALRYGKAGSSSSSSPEGRLYFSCIESALMPIGLFWFGWTSFPQIHWIVPTVAVCCATMGIFSIYLAVFNFLADTYHRYASSALAAQSFCRNMLGGVFPLIARQMFTAMT